VLVAGHLALRRKVSDESVDIPFGSRHDAAMMRIFLQLR
jgi:hypothetical protein